MHNRIPYLVLAQAVRLLYLLGPRFKLRINSTLFSGISREMFICSEHQVEVQSGIQLYFLAQAVRYWYPLGTRLICTIEFYTHSWHKPSDIYILFVTRFKLRKNSTLFPGISREMFICSEHQVEVQSGIQLYFLAKAVRYFYLLGTRLKCRSEL